MTNQPPAKLATQDDVHLAVGRALTDWEFFESEMAQIFSVLVRSNFIAASRAYGAVSNFHSRADMVAAAAESYFQTGRKPEHAQQSAALMKLLKDARSHTKHRNEIAHGVVGQAWEPGFVGGWCLMPAIYNSRKIKLPGHMAAYLHTATKVDEFRHQFQLLSGRAQKLCAEMKKHPPLTTKELEQEMIAALKAGPMPHGKHTENRVGADTKPRPLRKKPLKR
jgi:hypothetical protein